MEKTKTVSERSLDYSYKALEYTHKVLCFLPSWGIKHSAKLFSKFPWPANFLGLFWLMGLLCFAMSFTKQICNFMVSSERLAQVEIDFLAKHGVLGSYERFAKLLIILAIIYLCIGLLAFLKKRFTLQLIKVAAASFAICWLYLAYFIVHIPEVLLTNAEEKNLEMDMLLRNELWVCGIILWLPGLIIGALCLIQVMRISVRNCYCKREETDDLLGDRIHDDLKTHGEDPRYRSSFYWSFVSHIAVLILPLFIARGCFLDAYAIPKGSGQLQVQQIKVKKIKKKKKKKKLVLNMNSPIIYYVPDIDDTKVMEEMEEDSRDTYVATALKSGKLGKGGGKKGGWPNGMENATVRFIRLKYSGGDWDQDMSRNGDYKLLLYLKKTEGWKIANRTEAISVSKLGRGFRKKQKPPFVYITGKRGMRFSAPEIKVLRKYCLEEGGMIFADNGGGSFNSAFRSQIRRIFPQKTWVDISNDDEIFIQPTAFPNGAPPLARHSGARAMGIKHNGRWVVFYHQGDIGDAWKMGGTAGIRDVEADRAYKLGVNVMAYAYTKYLEINFGE